MLLHNEKDSITINQTNRSAIIREHKEMSGRTIVQKTTINLNHALPDYAPETMNGPSTFAVGQTVHLKDPHGPAIIKEIRVGHAVEVKRNVIELLTKRVGQKGQLIIIDYSQIN